MNIKELRQQLKMTQIELSNAVGVSVNSIRMWEQGGMNPSPENQRKLEELAKNKKA